MNIFGNININEYNYELPKEFIAQFPLKERDKARLLIYQQGEIKEDIFLNIDKYIPENSFLVFNNTKVIKARLLFTKPTGAKIEIFCLEPEKGMEFLSDEFESVGKSSWKCLVGKSGKWKHTILEKVVQDENITYRLFARVKDKTTDYFVIEFTWEPQDTRFYKILKLFGETPLPPYIKRKAIGQDELTYQTIYAKENGSVAAPTAGFHFTDEVFKKLGAKNINFLYLTLHIGIATFKPVKSETISEHKMHSEFILFEKEFIKTLYNNLANFGTREYRKVIAVGTTSTRALESLYYLGTQLFKSRNENSLTKLFSFKINQWEPYETNIKISPKESLELILEEMEKNSIERISGETEMIIVPGFQYKLIDGLITNFHLPKSTLLLLVSAFVGDKWKEIYNYALEKKFRFLSYGDGSLLFKE